MLKTGHRAAPADFDPASLLGGERLLAEAENHGDSVEKLPCPNQPARRLDAQLGRTGGPVGEADGHQHPEPE